MNLGCYIIFFVFCFVGFETIEATITSQHANEAIKKWRQKNSIKPDILRDYAVFMGASELTELRKDRKFSKPYTVLVEESPAEIAQQKKDNPKSKPTIIKEFENIDEGDFTYDDGGDKYHVIWGKSFVQDGDLKTGVVDKVVMGEVETVKVEGKEVENGGGDTVTLSAEKHLTPKMLVNKGIKAITDRWEGMGISKIQHNKFVEMRVGVFMLKCINTHKWDPTRAVVVLKLRYKSELKDTDYFLKQINAYRERTYINEKEAIFKFQEIKYNSTVSDHAAKDTEKWSLFLDAQKQWVDQATKDNQNESQNQQSNTTMQQTPSNPSNNPASSTKRPDSNAVKAFNMKETQSYFEEYANANADATKQKKIDDQKAKETNVEAAGKVAATCNKWEEHVKSVEKEEVDAVKAVYEARFLVLKEAKQRAAKIGYTERENMYRIELIIPKPSSPLEPIFTEQEYIIHKILEKKNEFPYFLYTHATDIGYGYRKTADGNSYATVVLIQVGCSAEEALNNTIYDVIVANIRKAMHASASLFNEKTDTLPLELYELVYGRGTNYELSKVKKKVLEETGRPRLTEEEIQAKIKAAQQDHLNTTAHPKEGNTSHDAPAPANKIVVKPGSLPTIANYN